MSEYRMGNDHFMRDNIGNVFGEFYYDDSSIDPDSGKSYYNGTSGGYTDNHECQSGYMEHMNPNTSFGTVEVAAKARLVIKLVALLTAGVTWVISAFKGSVSMISPTSKCSARGNPQV
jgi:hypothetical protein